ncbi:heme-binding protein 2-like [Macrobrachium rosenbergii]|uniref:heme-binding protein 2-like n=1 Tax=Macrobrachium rosenbergii TaxID=79674 RepID=UPI0034D64BD9
MLFILLQMKDNRTLWLAVISVALQFSVSLAVPYVKPIDEAPYKVIRKTENYEIRSYLPAKWVCYDYKGAEFTKRNQAMSFLTIFEYINGENSAGVNITLASPTTVRTVLSANNPQENLYQMCMFLPKVHQDNPPQPLEKGVFIQNRNKLTVAVRQFNHLMTKENEWEVQMEILKNHLKASNEPSMDFWDDFYGAAFDPPFDVNGRPNEVWVVKKE